MTAYCEGMGLFTSVKVNAIATTMCLLCTLHVTTTVCVSHTMLTAALSVCGACVAHLLQPPLFGLSSFTTSGLITSFRNCELS